MDKKTFWTRLISIIIIVGVLKSFFLPLVLPNLFGVPWMENFGSLVNLVVHFPILIGFIYFLRIGGKFKKKGEFPG